MANPDYATLLGQIAAETDPVLKQQLIDQCYIFEDPLTDDERELFEYCAFDYIENNPGYVEEGAAQIDTGLYVLPDYVADGYINIVTDLYMAEGYAEDGYVALVTDSTPSGFISYVGVYYDNNGDTT